jgi:NAD+ kinase
MKTLGIFLNHHREQARECAEEVAQLAREVGLTVAPEAEFERADLIVTVGGDGTLLSGARVAVPLDVPIIGLNTGRMGFLTEVEATPDGLARLREVLLGNFTVEERLTLQCAVNGEGTHFALNDVVVRRGEQARLTPFGLRLDDELVAHIPSDGVIVATPTGSTAYFLSAGGPIVSPKVDAFGIAALLPHTLFTRPLIVPTSSVVEITLDAESAQATLETDGTSIAALASGDTVTVTRGPRPVKFARTQYRPFFSRLEEKLQWGVPIKRS